MRILALHWAILSSNTNVIVPLLQAGASLDCINSSGQTPLTLANERGNNWICNKLKDEQHHRGVGKSGFIRNIITNPVREPVGIMNQCKLLIFFF